MLTHKSAPGALRSAGGEKGASAAQGGSVEVFELRRGRGVGDAVFSPKDDATIFEDAGELAVIETILIITLIAGDRGENTDLVRPGKGAPMGA